MAGDMEEIKCIQTPPSVNLEKFRKKVHSYINKHHYDTALFWADKIVSLSNGDIQDVFNLVYCLYLTGQYHRAAHYIKSRKLHESNLCCCYLTAKCHVQVKEWQDALETLEMSANNNKSQSVPTSAIVSSYFALDNIESSICLLKGHIYEAMDNRSLAAECFQEALEKDVYCYEAFDCLVQHHMLTAKEEHQLLETLPFNKQCTEDDIVILRFLYETKLNKYSKPNDLSAPSTLDPLNGNLDVVVHLAERHYYNCQFAECLRITQVVLDKDPFHSSCLPAHIACLVEMKKSNSLFYMAHKLVDLYPENPISWFAVGCYYLLVNKNEAARRYLSKATALERVFGPAWLAYGHSFAVENEHDQAMASYYRASQLMRGCHLPYLYIGLEYGLTNNTKLAERFLNQALSIAPEDPFVLHEMGLVAYSTDDWQTAERYFRDALKHVEGVHGSVAMDKWEPLVNNLGHTCRKLRKYDEALRFHRQALVLCPQNPTTLSAVGYVFALQGQFAAAIEYFHKALAMRRDDVFSTNVLKTCIEQMMDEAVVLNGDSEDPVLTMKHTSVLPSLTSPPKSAGIFTGESYLSQDPVEEHLDYLVDSSANTSSLLDVDMDGT